jgi:hypothetical protein
MMFLMSDELSTLSHHGSRYFTVLLRRDPKFPLIARALALCIDDEGQPCFLAAKDVGILRTVPRLGARKVMSFYSGAKKDLLDSSF